jgi:hypothetical protein
MIMVRFASKYHSQWTEYKGVKYQSKREARYAADLDLLVKAKEIKGWRRQVSFDLIVNSVNICKYVVDFEVEFANGQKEFHEVKGFSTDLFRLKFALFQALYPNQVIKIIR